MYMTIYIAQKSLWSIIGSIFITRILISRGLNAQQRHHHNRSVTGYIRGEIITDSQTKKSSSHRKPTKKERMSEMGSKKFFLNLDRVRVLE